MCGCTGLRIDQGVAGGTKTSPVPVGRAIGVAGSGGPHNWLVSPSGGGIPIGSGGPIEPWRWIDSCYQFNNIYISIIYIYVISQPNTPRFRCRPLRADGLALRVGALRHEDPGSFDQGAAMARGWPCCFDAGPQGNYCYYRYIIIEQNLEGGLEHDFYDFPFSWEDFHPN